MNLITFLLVGLVSGFFAGKLVEGRGFGAFGDIIVGIAGAFVGGFLFTNSNLLNGSFTGAVLTSTFGAIVFLLIAGLFQAVARPSKI